MLANYQVQVSGTIHFLNIQKMKDSSKEIRRLVVTGKKKVNPLRLM